MRGGGQMQRDTRMLARDSVMLHRRDDPSNEYREVILYENAGASRHWGVWESINFLSGPNAVSRSDRARGSEHNMRNFFKMLVEDLRKEGFTVCLRENIPAR